MQTIDELKKMELKDLVLLMVAKKSAVDDLKKRKEEAQKEYDVLRKLVIPEVMENLGIEKPVIKGVGRLTVRPDIYAGIVSGKKDEAYQWLQDNDHGDLIQDTINSSTLKAFLKEQMTAGAEIPEDLFKCDPYEMAVITKA